MVNSEVAQLTADAVGKEVVEHRREGDSADRVDEHDLRFEGGQRRLP